MNKNNPIGILDSGVGGLTVLNEAIKLMPNEDIIYFGDSKRMPYGNRSKEEIIEYSNKMIEFLEKEGVKTVLLACNTISSYIDDLTHNIPLVSIIDSATEYVTKVCSDKKIGLIATKATVENKAYEKSLKKADSYINLISNESTKLPKIIDSQIDNLHLLNKHIHQTIDPILKNHDDIHYLILGCSHFPIIKNEISAIYKGIELLDPAEYMVKNTKAYLKENNLLNTKNSESVRTLYTTADTLEFASYIKRLKLNITKLEKVNLLDSD